MPVPLACAKHRISRSRLQESAVQRTLGVSSTPLLSLTSTPELCALPHYQEKPAPPWEFWSGLSTPLLIWQISMSYSSDNCTFGFLSMRLSHVDWMYPYFDNHTCRKKYEEWEEGSKKICGMKLTTSLKMFSWRKMCNAMQFLFLPEFKANKVAILPEFLSPFFQFSSQELSQGWESLCCPSGIAPECPACPSSYWKPWALPSHCVKVIWDQGFKKTRNGIKTTVEDCFNLIFSKTTQQQHMALSEILLLHSLAAGLTETWEDRALCKSSACQHLRLGKKNQALVLVSSLYCSWLPGLSPWEDPSYRKCK